MSIIRDFIAGIADNQKKKPNQAQMNKLFESVTAELQDPAPDYDGCVLALTAFPHQVTGIFYDDIYTHLSKEVCTSFDSAFLVWAKSMPKIAGGNLAYLKMAQAIKKRLSLVSNAEDLLPELQWYISNFDDSRAAKETKKMRDECELSDLQKLLALDIQDWPINLEMLKKFYGILFSDFTGPATKELYQLFLRKNHLINELSSESPLPLSQTTDTPTDQNKASKNIPENLPQQMVKDVAENIPPSSTTVPSIPQQDSTELELEKNGVKLAELLLAWSKTQASGVAALKESLRVSEQAYKHLSDQFSNLREELFSVKKELGDRDAKITSLQRQLAEVAAHLDSSQKQAADFDETIRKLQRMNENSASQAVLGYKSELAAALKSIVEDACLPEAKKDTDILSALLGDMLDTLRFKGVPLEEK